MKPIIFSRTAAFVSFPWARRSSSTWGERTSLPSIEVFSTAAPASEQTQHEHTRLVCVSARLKLRKEQGHQGNQRRGGKRKRERKDARSHVRQEIEPTNTQAGCASSLLSLSLFPHLIHIGITLTLVIQIHTLTSN